MLQKGFCLSISLFLLVSVVHGQVLPPCNSQANFAADACYDACAGCPLNGYQGTTAGFTGAGGSFCGGQLNETNSVWHGFIAGSSTISFSVSSNNCTQGDGLQIAVFPECGDAIACNTGQQGSAGQPIVLSYSGFTPGQAYLLMINGYNGDVCNYSVSTLLGSCDLPALSAVGNLNGPAQICPGGTYTYTLTPNSGAIGYEWSAPQGASINNTGQNTLITSGNSVEITFPSQGSFQVKARALGYCGASTPFATKNIQSQAIPPTILPTLLVDPSELPYTWFADPNTTISSTGSFQLLTTFSSYFGCDSIVRQLVIVTPYPAGIVFWDLNGNNVYNEGTDLPADGIQVSTANGITTQTDSEGLYELPFLPQGTGILIPALPTFTLQLVPQEYQYQPLSSGYYPFALQPQKGTATGRAYTDTDQNLQFNAGDIPIAQLMIRTSSGKTAFTDIEGNYLFPEVAFPEEIAPILLPDMQITGSSSLLYLPDITTGYDFTISREHVYGAVYWDTNPDGGIGLGDLPAPLIPIHSSNGFEDTTNLQGVYTISNVTPGDTLRVNLLGVSSIPDFHVVQQVLPAGGYPFLLSTNNLQSDLQVDATNLTMFRPGFTTKVVFTVTNNSGYPIPNSGLGVRFPAFLQFSQAQPYTQLLGTDSLHWPIVQVAPYESRQFVVWLHTPIQTLLGTQLQIRATIINPLGDLLPGNNNDIITTNVVGSFDPNDKQVQPAFLTPAELIDDPGLEYTIRFQNTGNYPADFVTLLDSLSNQLAWAEFRFVSSSHPCTWELDSTGLLRFFFEDIQLPDSLSDPEGSQGFVKFWIPIKSAPAIGTTVSNFCDIYFDFNAAIRTNTAELQVVLFPPGNTPSGNSAGFSVRPNPATFVLFFSWPDPLPAEGTLRLFNLLGIPEKTVQLEQGSTSVRVEIPFIPDGVYYARLESVGILLNKTVLVQKAGPIRKR